ncbi:MAG: hypothetical protein APR54_01845 [Candidatus Cloacimonas sp. SDB]|nr:MAG: hypothetical protein APR54_01845 [Candidatus Cloacimonas sp. SDB]
MKVLKLMFLLSACLITSTLAAQWSEYPDSNTAVSILAGSQALPKIGLGPEGDVYIGFFSNETGNYDVRLQRYDASGYAQWQDNGILVSDNPSMTWITDWDMAVDQDNNAILAFQDIRTGNNDVFAYSISPDGEFNWGEDGLQLSEGTAFDVSPKIAITTNNNALITWQADDVVIMQKISPGGDLLWGENGITLSGANTYSWPQPLAIDNDEIILKFFEDSGVFPATTRHVLAQRFDLDGNPVWDDYTIISNSGGISVWTQIFSMVEDGNNGFFIAWNDDRDMDMDNNSFVQHINAEGEALFAANGVAVATTVNRERFYPELIFNAAQQELMVFWKNTDSAQNNTGLAGQKFNLDGEYIWGNNGLDIIALSTNSIGLIGAKSSPYGNIIFFDEAQGGVNSMIRAILLDHDGNYVWDPLAVTLCSVDSQKLHSVAGDFANNQWIAAWEDTRNDAGDIYAQNISFMGELGPVETLAGISGTVTINEGGGDVAEVVITAGGNSTNPEPDGTYSIFLDPGIYTITASLLGYETETMENIEVLEEQITENINFILELESHDPPYNVQIEADTGLLTWEHPYVVGEEIEEGFEDEDLPQDWLNVDSDGDSFNWFIYTYSPHSGSQSIASASWVSPDGALNPDNWLISPALYIGTDSQLHFWYAAQDEMYPADHFAVYLSDYGNAVEDFTEILFETTIVSSEWTEVVIDMNEYLDQAVYLAWRHFDCTDQFYMKIDDISLINAVTREVTFLADFESARSRNNFISRRTFRDRELESYNVYLDDAFIINTTDLSYTFTGLINGETYNAGVSALYTYGESDIETVTFTYTGTGSDNDLIISKTSLKGNYPNPFNPHTTIRFQLAEADEVELTIYNLKGQKIREIIGNELPAGNHQADWDGTDAFDQPVTSGIYLYKLSTSNHTDVKKMILLR